MIKISMNFTTKQLEEIIDQLPSKDRIRLVRKLKKKPWAKQLQDIFDDVDTKRKKSKITNKELWNEVKKARKEFYADRP